MVIDSTDDTNISDVMLMEGSQDNYILTTVDNITLQSNMNYTIQVPFSNLDGEFNLLVVLTSVSEIPHTYIIHTYTS